MKAVIAALALSLLGVVPANAADIHIEIDASAANALITAIGNPALDKAEASRVSALEGSQAVIAKVQQTNDRANAAVFERSLLAVAHGQILNDADDPFSFRRLYEKRAEAAELANKLIVNADETLAEGRGRVGSFAPPKLDMKVTVFLVAAGGADGWANDARGSARPDRQLFISINQFSGDLDGLALLMAHEVYHVAQARIERPNFDRDRRALKPCSSSGLALLEQLRDEGSASLVGDALGWPGNGRYLTWFRSKFRRNLDHIQENATLFDALLSLSSSDDSIPYHRLYPLAFLSDWDSNAYFLGYAMAQEIDKHSGRDALVSAVFAPDPSAFIRAYINIAEAADAGNARPKFSKGTMLLLDKMMRDYRGCELHRAGVTTGRF